MDITGSILIQQLHDAAKNKDWESVSLLLDRGVDIHTIWSDHIGHYPGTLCNMQGEQLCLQSFQKLIPKNNVTLFKLVLDVLSVFPVDSHIPRLKCIVDKLTPCYIKVSLTPTTSCNYVRMTITEHKQLQQDQYAVHDIRLEKKICRTSITKATLAVLWMIWDTNIAISLPGLGLEELGMPMTTTVEELDNTWQLMQDQVKPLRKLCLLHIRALVADVNADYDKLPLSVMLQREIRNRMVFTARRVYSQQFMINVLY